MAKGLCILAVFLVIQSTPVCAKDNKDPWAFPDEEVKGQVQESAESAEQTATPPYPSQKPVRDKSPAEGNTDAESSPVQEEVKDQPPPQNVQAPAQEQKAAQNEIRTMKFEVYAGGINAVQAEMNVDLTQKGRYSFFFGAETQGFLENFVPWKGTFESKGWALKDGARKPELHESIAMWRDEREVKSYHYDKNKGFQNIVTTYVGKKPKTEESEKELTQDTTDVLTATLMMMENVGANGECNGASEIFDGKRRFAMIFRHVGYVMMPPSRYNAYSGPATECTVEVKPLAGAWHKKPRGWLSIQEQGRSRGMMPTVWFAKINGDDIAVPVRVRVKTAYGTMFMHLVSYEKGDIKIVAQK